MAGPSFLDHDGKRILRLDYTGLTPPEVITCMQDARRLIAAEPLRSVRLLSIVAIHITEEIVRALQEFAAHNVPFVLASAIVGATSFQRAAIVITIASRGRLNVEVFDDEESAKDWLAAR